MAARKGSKSTSGKDQDTVTTDAVTDDSKLDDSKPEEAHAGKGNAGKGNAQEAKPEDRTPAGEADATAADGAAPEPKDGEADERADKPETRKTTGSRGQAYSDLKAAGVTPAAASAIAGGVDDRDDGDTDDADQDDYDPYRVDDLDEPGPSRADDGHDHGLDQGLDHGLDHGHEDEPGHRSLAATALTVLVTILVIAGLTLWAAPKVAPHLPAGVAKYLMPGEVDTAARIAALEEKTAGAAEKTNAEVAALRAEVAALAGQVAERPGADALAAARTTAEGAAADVNTLMDRLSGVEKQLSGMHDELAAISSALGEAAAGAGASSPELAAKIAALGARLDKLAAAVDENMSAEALSGQIATLAARLDVVESNAADARSAQDEKLGEVSTAVQAARVQAALDVLYSRLAAGLPYNAKLNEIAEMTGKTPPEPLSAGAGEGVATAAALEASFGRQAHEAIAADVKARSGEGLGALGWLRSQFAGRPVDEREGDSVAAVTSRIGARIAEGNLPTALAEAESLPDHAREAMGRWLAQLRQRVGAEKAFDEWRTELGTGG